MKDQTPQIARKASADRRGAIAVIAMITLLITISIGLGLVRTALQAREQAHQWEKRTQARWLTEAGIERAVAQLKKSADYEGETWTLSADQLGRRDGGEVRIKLEPVAESYRLTVVADYPAESERRIRSRKVVTIANPNSTENDEP